MAIFFNKKLHKYTNDRNEAYLSVTSFISEYHPHFDTKKMAKIIAQKGEGQYKGMSTKQVIKHWDNQRDAACAQGHKEHAVLEDAIKEASNVIETDSNIVKLITIDDIIERGKVEVDVDLLINRLPSRHSVIINTIRYFIDHGFIPYSEICVYNDRVLISGLGDLFFINFDTKEFITGDYKTNKADIRFEAGYFKKDSNGNLTSNFVETGERMFNPISHLANSTGNKYALQLSIYSALVQERGFTHKGNVLFHIKRNDRNSMDEITDTNSVVKCLPIPYLYSDVQSLFHSRYMKLNNLFL